MSSFSKRGYKESQKKFVNFHSKGVKSILAALDLIHTRLCFQDAIQVTEANIAELAEPFLGRPLDSMELNILKGKFGFHESEDNAK